jgi:hypothetical protein
VTGRASKSVPQSAAKAVRRTAFFIKPGVALLIPIEWAEPASQHRLEPISPIGSTFSASKTICETGAGDVSLMAGPKRRIVVGELFESRAAASGLRYTDAATNGRKASQPGGRWLRRVGGFAGRAAPANVLPKRRHAASDNKTYIQAWIFPNSPFLILKHLLRPPLLHA